MTKRSVGRQAIQFAGLLLTLLTYFLLAQGYSLAQTRVVYWNMYNRTQYEEELVKKFNETHPHIQVELLPIPPGAAHLIAAEVAGDLPDLVYIARGVISDLMRTGILKDLTPYVEQAGWKLDEEWIPATYLSSMHKGSNYAIPRDGFPLSFLAWNKSLFAEAGLDPELPPSTLEEVEGFHRRIMRRDADGMAERIGFIPWTGLGNRGQVQSLLWGSNWWDPVSNQVIINNERNVQMMQWLQSWAHELQGSLDPTWLTSGGSSAFIGGRLGMQVVNASTIIQYDEEGWTPHEIGVAPYPQTPGDDIHRLYMAGESFAIPARAKNPDEAWVFMKWMLENEQAAEFAQKSGVPPARIESARYFMEEQRVNSLYRTMMEAAFQSEAVAVLGTPLDIEPAWREMDKALAAVINLQKDPRSALEEAHQVVSGHVRVFLEENGPWWE